MKTLIVLGFILAYAYYSPQDINPYTCTFNGKKLYGKVKIVNSGEDFKVRIVESSEDITIINTEREPAKCGEWKFVDYSEDLKVRFVTSGEDFKIRYTTGESRINKTSSNEYNKEIDKSNCTFHGIALKGKVKVVTSFPDIKVKLVENFEDIKVQVVSNFPDHCGEWQFVENFPDFTIQYVTDFPDIKIRFVENFPGIR